jgi:putative ribosome biogenesis GTPase RsgA
LGGVQAVAPDGIACVVVLEEAVEHGEIPVSRYVNYLSILEEVTK